MYASVVAVAKEMIGDCEEIRLQYTGKNRHVLNTKENIP